MDTKKLLGHLEMAYDREYQTQALQKQKGWKGKFLRFFVDKEGRSNVRFPLIPLGTLLTAIGLMAALPPAVAIIPFAAWAGGFFGTLATAAYAERPVSARADAAFKADLDSGALVSRYKAEYVDKRLAGLPALKDELTQQSADLAALAAKPDFTAAAAKEPKKPLVQRLGLKRGSALKP